jgi:hypothetical protein
VFEHFVKIKKEKSEWAPRLYANIGKRGIDWTVKKDCYFFKKSKHLTLYLLRWS